MKTNIRHKFLKYLDAILFSTGVSVFLVGFGGAILDSFLWVLLCGAGLVMMIMSIQRTGK